VLCPKSHKMAVYETRQADCGGMPSTRRTYRCWRCDVSVITYEVLLLEDAPAHGGHNGSRPAAVVTHDQLLAIQALRGAVQPLRDEATAPTKTGRRRRMPQNIRCSAYAPCDDPRCGHCKTLQLPLEEDK
jgi:hypothetical protein